MKDHVLCRDCRGMVLSEDHIFASGHVKEVVFEDWDKNKESPALQFKKHPSFEGDSQYIIKYRVRPNGYGKTEYFYHISLDSQRTDIFPSFPTLEASAVSGCSFCQLLRDTILKKVSKFQKMTADDDSYERFHEWFNFEDGEEVDITFGYFLKYHNSKQQVRNQSIQNFGSRDVSGLGRLSAFITKKNSTQLVALKDEYDEDNDPFSFSPTHVNFSMEVDGRANDVGRYLQIYDIAISEAPWSNQNIEHAKNFLSICINNHEDPCGFRSSRVNWTKENAPTRLLWIGGPDVRLIIPSQADGGGTFLYAALSYCWGKSQTFKTYQTNLNQWLRSMPLKAMPPTFRDAIQVATDLGIRYLWIDSLCIVQDDPEDWKRESSRMADIYRGAFFTIVVASVSSSNESFLVPRAENLTRYPHVEMDFQSKRYPQVSGHYFLREDNDDGPNILDEMELSHWGTRGWTFQEQYLSKRLLVFGPSMLQFHCLGLSLRENCYTLFERELFDSPLFSRHHHSDCHAHEHDNLYASWYQLIEIYSQRELTFIHDRLIAIQGIAKEMVVSLSNHDKRDRYLAGLWEGDLPNGLMWTSKPGKMKDNDQHGIWIAPTWSWASHLGPISFGNTTLGTKFQISEVLESNVTPENGFDEFGALSAGLLKLKGPVAHFDSLDSPEISSLCGNLDQKALHDDVGLFLDTRDSKELDKRNSGPVVFLVLFGTVFSDNVDQFSGLILKKAEQKETENLCFVRIGVFKGNDVSVRDEQGNAKDDDLWPIESLLVA